MAIQNLYPAPPSVFPKAGFKPSPAYQVVLEMYAERQQMMRRLWKKDRLHFATPLAFGMQPLARRQAEIDCRLAYEVAVEMNDAEAALFYARIYYGLNNLSLLPGRSETDWSSLQKYLKSAIG